MIGALLVGFLIIGVVLAIALALDKTRDIPLCPVEVMPINRRSYTPGVVLRAGQLVRVIEARRAVRGDDGYVKASRA